MGAAFGGGNVGNSGQLQDACIGDSIPRYFCIDIELAYRCLQVSRIGIDLMLSYIAVTNSRLYFV